MTRTTSPSLSPAVPFSRAGRQSLAILSYLGGMAFLIASAVRRSETRTRSDGSVLGELGWMLAMGGPLVALVHVGVGSFLSMQAYFGGTFVEGTGAVVGVGLIRNVAPLMVGMTMAGLLAARIIPELRAWRREFEPPRSTERVGLLERTATSGLRPTIASPSPSSLVAPRLAGAMIAGVVLSVWGTAVGMLVGWQVGQTMVGVSTHSFFLMFQEMLWTRDIVGLVVKGLAYGFFAAAFACFEGLRGSADDGLERVASAALRASCLALVAILIVNSGWFILVYHAGPAFGPTLLAPPVL